MNFVGARVVLGHDGLARGAKGEAEVVDHGDQGAAHDAGGHEGGKAGSAAPSATPSAVRRPSPPQVTPVVACHQEWSSRSPLTEALTEARIEAANRSPLMRM